MSAAEPPHSSDMSVPATTGRPAPDHVAPGAIDALVMSEEECRRSPRRLLPGDVVPDDLDAPFWAGCRQGQFLLHRCTRCGRTFWPASSCTVHGGEAMAWVPSSGRGTVDTYTVVHHAYDRSLADVVPYAVVVVALDEGPLFHSDLVGCPVDDVAVGLAVEVTWEVVDEATVVPHFRPRRQRP